MSSPLDLNHIFSHLTEDVYCIVKLSPAFPEYRSGEDIDMFCFDINRVSDKIIQCAHGYINDGYTVRSTVLKENCQLHLDFLYENRIEFRFDLYQNLPAYRKVSVKSGFFSHVIDNRQSKILTYNNRPYCIYTPCRQDELIMRYLEYVEYFHDRPDKIKHANYILDALEKTPADISFLDTLHYYIEIPPIDIESNRFARKKPPLFKRVFFYIVHFPSRIVRRIRRLAAKRRKD